MTSRPTWLHEWEGAEDEPPARPDAIEAVIMKTGDGQALAFVPPTASIEDALDSGAFIMARDPEEVRP